MKLIDLLVQELPKRGGWPEGINVIEQNFHGKLFNGSKPYRPFLFDDEKFEIVDEWREARVTREQYEAALAAAQQPVWDGEGLPPVGCECEAKYRDAANAEWFFFRCVGVDCGIAFGWAGKDAVTLDKGTFEFRPIHSEADKRRDDVIESIFDILNDYDFEVVHIRGDQKRMATDIVERIASGMIPHIRIE
ncbi:UNVERIFIED_ASMBLY: hypothetical protein E7W40_10100 [Cronobacter sakazakii]|nr:hypothetical protein [Cronobacter sakazakii]